MKHLLPLSVGIIVAAAIGAAFASEFRIGLLAAVEFAVLYGSLALLVKLMGWNPKPFAVFAIALFPVIFVSWQTSLAQ